ncbi:MAG: 3'-5' exonuclease [Myxococcota bacterium]|nr:3'-5' exonuclease [Myxococcota bacterium]
MQNNTWFEADIAIFDVETTGLSATKDRVIEIGIVHMRAGEVIESWGQLIDPEREIPAEVAKLTGIQQEELTGQPTFDAVAKTIAEKLQGKVLCAYNHEFDMGFLRAELTRAGVAVPDAPCLDPLVFAREIQKEHGSKKLGKVAERLGISLEGAHRAVNDAEATGHVLYAFRDELPPGLTELLELQKHWALQQEQLMAMRRRWRGDLEAGSDLQTTVKTVSTEDGIVLGPAYVYGNEPDPIRFFYSQLPDVGTTRR